MNWELEKMRSDIITSLGSHHGAIRQRPSVSYAAPRLGQRNTWMVNNADRVLSRQQQGQRRLSEPWPPRWRRSPPRPAR